MLGAVQIPGMPEMPTLPPAVIAAMKQLNMTPADLQIPSHQQQHLKTVHSSQSFPSASRRHKRSSSVLTAI